MPPERRTHDEGNPGQAALPGSDIRLARAVADPDPEQQRISRALRLELEGDLVRSRRDSSSLTVERWSARLTSALRRADRAENRLARLEQRRWFRLSQVLVEIIRHPVRLPALLTQLLGAFRKQPLPESPEHPAVQLSPPRVRSTSQRPAPYAHLRVAHCGRVRAFDGLARHSDITDLADADPDHFDLLLLEPGLDEPLSGVPVEQVDRFRRVGKPTVLFARTSEHLRVPHASRVSLLVTEEPDLAEGAQVPTLVLSPSVDPRLHNPLDWQREPEGKVLDLDQQPALWGEALMEEVKAHAVVTTKDPATALIATAAGTPVVAHRTPELDELLGDSYIAVDPEGAIERRIREMQDPMKRESLSVAARRHVLTRHSRLARWEELLEHLSIPLTEPPLISVLLATKRPQRLEAAITNVTRQNWPRLELILILHDPTRFDPVEVRGVISDLDYPIRIVECAGSSVLGDCLNAGLEQAGGEYIAKMDDDDEYGELHVADLYTALSYAEAAAVGKLANVTYLTDRDLTVDWRIEDQERFVHHLPGATMLMRRELALRYRFDRVEHGVDTALWERMRADGLSLYSTHRMNFVRVRHDHHTYSRSNADFLALARTPPEQGMDRERWFA